MSDLNSAIQLIREGRKDEAQRILESLLQADPANIQAWFWYVETCSTLEKRIQVLETCLKMNPGNSQVTQALQTLKNQRPAQTAFTSPPAQSPKPVISPSSTPYSSLYDDEPLQSPAPSYASAYLDDLPTAPPVVTNIVGQPSSQSEEKKPWEDLDSYVDTSMRSKKPKPAAKSYAFYEVWMTVLTLFDIESYEGVLNDPEAGAGRAFEWIAYVGIISGLIGVLSIISNPQLILSALKDIPEFSRLFGNINTTALMLILASVLVLVTPIVSVIGLAVSAGIQNLLAVLFGGTGNYSRTAYAVAAYLAPMTLLIALLGIVPFVGKTLTSLLGLYNIILNIRALRAAHSISIWQALGVMIAPTIILIILGCLLIVFILPGFSR